MADHDSLMNTDDPCDDDVVVIDDLDRLSSIYDDDMVEKYNDSNGKNRWRCKWCGTTFSGWNATKALFHVTKTPKSDIKICRVRIDAMHERRYSELLQRSSKKRERYSTSNETIERPIVSHNDKTASILDTKKSSSVTPTAKKRNVNECDNLLQHSVGTNTTLSSKSAAQAPGFFTPSSTSMKENKSFVQMLIHDGSIPTAESKLTMSIADMIHCCGLPLSLVSDPKFRKVLSLAKAVGKNYQPPSRNFVPSELLDLNYDVYIKKNQEVLYKEADVFGISFFGDGATIKKLPLINMLGYG